MPTYTVTAAQNEKRLPAKDDRPELAIHRYEFAEVEGAVERVAKLDTALPAIGSKLEGTIEKTNFGPKFKPAPRGFGGAGGGFRADPERSRRIERQHSQHMALLYIESKAGLGQVKDFTFEDVQKLTDAFDNDLNGGGHLPTSDVPADETGL